MRYLVYMEGEGFIGEFDTYSEAMALCRDLIEEWTIEPTLGLLGLIKNGLKIYGEMACSDEVEGGAIVMRRVEWCDESRG